MTTDDRIECNAERDAPIASSPVREIGVGELPAGLWQTARDGRTVYMDSTMRTLLGLSPANDGGQLTPETVLDAESLAARQAAHVQIKAGQMRTYAVQMTVPETGAPRHMLVRGAPVYSAEGAFAGILELFSPLPAPENPPVPESGADTDARLLPHALAQIDLAILLTDRQGNILYRNAAVRQLLGGDPPETISALCQADGGFCDAHTSARIHPDEFVLFQALRSHEKHARVYALRRDRPPRNLYVRAMAYPLHSAEVPETYAILLLQDVSEQMAAELALRESEERLRRAIYESPVPLMMHAEDGHVLHLNKAWTEMTGYRREEIPTVAAWLDLAYEAGEREKMAKVIQKMYSSREKIIHGVQTIRLKSGERHNWAFKSAPLGKCGYRHRVVVTMAKDMTQVEMAAERERLQRAALDTAANAIAITDRQGCIQWVNPAFTRLTGHRQEEAVGQNFCLLKSGLMPPEFYREMWETILGGHVWRGDLINRRKDGHEYHEEMTITPLRGRSGEIEHFICIKNDVTARKRSEKALRESEARLRAFIGALPEHVLIVDSSGRLEEILAPEDEKLSEKIKEFEGKTVHDMLDPETATRFVDSTVQTVTTGTPQVLEFRIEKLDAEKWFEGRTSPLAIGNGTPAKVVWTVRDVTDRKRAESMMEESYSRLDEILASISLIMLGIDSDDRIMRWNEAAEKAFGVPAAEVIGKSFFDCGIDWDWPTLLHRIAECRDKEYSSFIDEVVYRRPDGKKGFLNISINPIVSDVHKHNGYLLLGAEITEYKVMQGQLVQAQKLESIGQLAAGIAHEINTPIQFVGDNIYFLHDAYKEIMALLDKYRTLVQADKKAGANLRLIEEIEKIQEEVDLDYLHQEIPKAFELSQKGIERVSNIVGAMKEFSHPGMEEKSLIDVNKALENTILVSRNEWKYVAELETQFAENLPKVPCLPGELNQVFLNIIVNAAHAIADRQEEQPGGKGRITVATRQVGPDFSGVEIAISDTGSGIPEEIRGRIFDPFFTTKPVGKGTGQGLAISYNVIVEKHGGRLTFTTESGKGTTFRILLPLNA